ncbi:MAG: hypothetical protein J7M24_06745 [Candidatus Latescibacteria bacterium]|nr:hypothetical protein [Candidatus Latescibacterota bacterium]
MFWINRICTIAFAGITLLAAAFPADAREYRAWPGDFMRMGAGARALGMGNAYSAIPGDIYSSYFNPAGLSYMQSRQMAFSFRYLSMDRMFRYFALGSPIGPDAGFALSWTNAGTDNIVGRDLNGNPTKSLEDNRNVFTFSFGKNIGDKFSLGINTKLGYWKLVDDNAKSFGFDLGFVIRPINDLALSFAARDIMSRYTWASKHWNKYISGADGQSMEKEDKFPFYYTGGVSYSMLNDKLLAAIMLELIEEYPLGVDAGVSYAVYKVFTIRTGVYNYTTDNELQSGSYTAGFSLQVTGSISLDYAFTADRFDGDDTHVIAITMGFEE